MEVRVSLGTVALRGAAALLLVALAVVLALAAHDVFAWRGQTARANVAVASFSSDPGVWQPGTWLPVGASRSLLGTGDDVRFGRALQRLQILRGRVSCPVSGDLPRVNVSGQQPSACATFDPSRVELASLELAFDNISRSKVARSVRSRAQQLYALVLFQQLALQGGNSGVDALTTAIAGLQHALRTDPANAEAAYDLEALLELYRPIAVEQASELARRRGTRGDTGAAGGSPGAGAVGAGGF